jgi:hypothetical protein
MMTSPKFPVIDWFKQLALYTPVDIGPSSPPAVKAILTFTGKLDFYCPDCAQEATFEGILSTETQNSISSEIMAIKGFGFASGFWTQHVFSKQLNCTRAGHSVSYYFQLQNGKLLKVGQFPAIADIHYGEVRHYLPILGEARSRDIQQAIALASSNLGIAAYSYIKKLFASLLGDAQQRALAANQAPASDYASASYQQRVRALAAYLPEFIVQHPEFYSLLDEPLESLNDSQCLAAFDALKTAVLFMVDHKMAQHQYQQRLQEAAQLTQP